jgi:TolA-binding protein
LVIGEARRIARPAIVAAVVFLLTSSVHAQLFGGDTTARQQIADQAKRLDAIKQQNDELAARLARIEESLKSLTASGPALELAQQLECCVQEVKQMRGQLEVVGQRRPDVRQAPARHVRGSRQPAEAFRAGRHASPTAAPGRRSGTAAACRPGRHRRSSPAQRRPPWGRVRRRLPRRALTNRAEPEAHRQLPGRDRRFPDFHRAVPEEPARPAGPSTGSAIRTTTSRDYRNAIANQNKLIATYPDSATIPDALLNIASCQIELGDTVGARKTMDGLVSRYPSSEAAEKAKRRLATLK